MKGGKAQPDAVQPVWNFACNRGTADRHGVSSSFMARQFHCRRAADFRVFDVNSIFGRQFCWVLDDSGLADVLGNPKNGKIGQPAGAFFCKADLVQFGLPSHRVPRLRMERC